MLWSGTDKPVRRIVGMMSGTSVDGVDAALVELRGAGDRCQVELLGARVDRERLERAAAAGIPVLEELRPGAFYPLTVDCSGAQGGIRSAMSALEKGGTLLQVGIATREVTLPYDQVVYREWKIQGSFCHTWKDWRQALRLEETGRLDLSPVVTGEVELEDWQSAFEDLLDKKGMKTLFRIGGEEAAP